MTRALNLGYGSIYAVETARRPWRCTGGLHFRGVTISVIVCAHDEERYVAACLHSLLAQSRPPDEIIVINNASSDRTHEAAAIAGVRAS